MEDRHKHLEFVQLTITRMGVNSFLLKGWAVTLVSALFVLSSENSEDIYIVLALLPGFLFWGLDGYFLWQERRFRDIYGVVRKRSNERIDFAIYYPCIEKDDKGLINALFSPTIVIFYGFIISTIGLVWYMERCNG